MGPFALSPGAPEACGEQSQARGGGGGSSGAAVTAARLKAIGDALQGRTEGQGRPGLSVVPGAPALAWLSLAALAALAWLSRRGSR